eukprot:g11380.t1
MELPTIQNGERKLVKIKQGQMFCLPSRIPHSPQRPEAGSFGLVVERRREGKEMDGLIFYEDFNTCKKVRWEKFFRCNDLGKDLPPVIEAYKAWEAAGASAKEFREEDRPVNQEKEIEVPEPFSFEDCALRSGLFVSVCFAVQENGKVKKSVRLTLLIWGSR